MKRLVFNPGSPGPARDLGLLVLRVAAAAAMIGAHGWGKLVHFSQRSGGFPDPIGLGSEASLGLAVFAEVFCGVALILGVGGRLAAVVLTVFFAVAFFLVHGGDPFGERELAFLYLAIFAVLALSGPGRFSLDRMIRGK